MAPINRRVFVQSAVAAGTIPLVALYPTRANAWFWFLARALASFAGRTVGRQAVRTAMRTGARATRSVTTRSSGYVTRMRPYYRESRREHSYPYAEFVGKELGSYGAESAVDYLYNLNNSHYGGAESTFVYDHMEDNGGVGFSTGGNSSNMADFHISHLTALDTCSGFLQQNQFTKAEMTGLLYPVATRSNNFSQNGYARSGYVSYNTAFGKVKIKSYHVSDREVRADIIARDSLTNRLHEWYGVRA